MQIREATPEERALWKDHPGVWMDLASSEVLVAEKGGQVIGFLCAQQVYQVEHLVMLKGNTITKSRAALQLYRSIEWFIRSRGGKQIYAVTRRNAVKKWADRLGWTRCYKGAALFTKFF